MWISSNWGLVQEMISALPFCVRRVRSLLTVMSTAIDPYWLHLPYLTDIDYRNIHGSLLTITAMHKWLIPWVLNHGTSIGLYWHWLQGTSMNPYWQLLQGFLLTIITGYIQGFLLTLEDTYGFFIDHYYRVDQWVLIDNDIHTSHRSVYCTDSDHRVE